MDIPESVNMRETLHGHGAKGMAIYGYEDAAGHGVRMEARRANGRSPFIETWFLDALPGREFKTFKELRDAALPLTVAEIEAATTGAYPLIKTLEPDPCGNRCRLCPRPPFDPEAPIVKHETWRITIAYSWKDLHSLSVCDAHMERFESDPKGLKEAIDAEVAERRARAAAKGLL